MISYRRDSPQGIRLSKNLRIGVFGGIEAIIDIILSNNEVAEDSAIDTYVGTLITEGGVAPYIYTLDNTYLKVVGDEVLVKSDLTGLVQENITIDVTDAKGQTFQKIFTIDIEVIDNGSGIGDDDGVIVDDGGFEVIVVDDTNDGLKFTGKTGGNAKFVYDVGVFVAGSSKIISYSVDYSLMNRLGQGVFAGLGFKSGDNWWFVGIRGDGAAPTIMHDWQITGTDFGNRIVGTHLDAGISEHGTKDGPNWLKITVSENGETATVEYSGDSGATWDAAFVDADPTSLVSLSDAPTSGFAMYFPNGEKGVFSLTVAQWATTLMMDVTLSSIRKGVIIGPPSEGVILSSARKGVVISPPQDGVILSSVRKGVVIRETV